MTSPQPLTRKLTLIESCPPAAPDGFVSNDTPLQVRKRASHETARDGFGIHQDVGEFCPKRGQQRQRRSESRQPAGIRRKMLVDAANRIGQTLPCSIRQLICIPRLKPLDVNDELPCVTEQLATDAIVVPFSCAYRAQEQVAGIVERSDACRHGSPFSSKHAPRIPRSFARLWPADLRMAAAGIDHDHHSRFLCFRVPRPAAGFPHPV